MNYLDIIIKGFYNQNNRNFLKNYFLRQLKKAEVNQYTKQEFIRGCKIELSKLEDNIQTQLNLHKHELYEVLSHMKKQNKLDEVVKIKKQINRLSPNDFYVNMTILTKGKIRHQLSIKDITLIKNSINSLDKSDSKIYKEEFPNLFIELTNYKLFKYLEENYENDKKPSKYSWIYHFISKEIGNETTISKKKYIEYLKKDLKIQISKIQNDNNVYHKSAKPFLNHISKTFYKKE